MKALHCVWDMFSFTTTNGWYLTQKKPHETPNCSHNITQHRNIWVLKQKQRTKMSFHHFDSSHAKQLQTGKFQELNCQRSLGSILEFIILDSYFISIFACIDMDIYGYTHTYIHTHHHYLFIPVSMSRKLIVFIVGAGLLLLFLGSTLVFLYSRFRQTYS